MKKQRLIYSLCCPFTNEVHYIGKSTQGMIRPLHHLSDSHSEKIKEWVESLKEIAHAPVVKILEYVSIEEDLDGRERYWIQRELNKNSLLLNSNLVTPLLVNSKIDQVLKEEVNSILQISNFIKVRRKQAGLTQEEFASKAGVALTVIRKLEQGKSNINVNGLMQILKMFGATIEIVKIKKYDK